MIKVAVWFHKDGDHLVVEQVPWWTGIWEWITHRIAPCCGLSAALAHSAVFANLLLGLWHRMLNFSDSRAKVLYKTPILSGCQASRALYDPHGSCCYDECEYCWQDREGQTLEIVREKMDHG